MRLGLIAFILLFLVQASVGVQVNAGSHGSRSTLPRSSLSRCRIIRSTSPKAATRPMLVIMPGGPGFSASIIEPLRKLDQGYDLCLLDPPGGGQASPLTGHLTYEGLIRDFEGSIRSLNRPVVLIGHSAGGVEAADILVRRRVNAVGLISLDSPFSPAAVDVADRIIKEHTKKSLFDPLPPTKNSLKALFPKIADLYFQPPNRAVGIRLVVDDPSSYSLFPLEPKMLDKQRLEKLTSQLTLDPRPKLAIAGEEDGLFGATPKPGGNPLLTSAQQAGMRTVAIPDASHFVYYDQPEKTIAAIRHELAAMPTEP